MDLNGKTATHNKLDFFLEIGVEEIPSSLINEIKNFIESGIQNLLKAEKLDYSNSVSYGSARRLFFEINGLSQENQDEEIILRGPAEKIGVEIAADGSKAFTKVAEGFAKKNNLLLNDLYIENGYLYAKSYIKGKSLKSILETSLSEIIAKTPGKRFMRWSDNENKFTRPIEWISCFIVNPETKFREEINFNFENISSAPFSYGLRIYGKKSFTFNSSEEYFQALKAENIILKTDERKASIISQAEKLAASVNGIAILDEELLEEICGLIESPKAVLCEFSAKYLEVPSLILKTVMKVHQRYIPIAKASEPDSLSHYFIVISNNPEVRAEKNIKAGNEKVIIPRFEDARFFLNEDNKISLADRLPRLAKINFQVGNMQEKAERLQKMTKILIEILESTNIDLNKSGIQPSSSYGSLAEQTNSRLLIDTNEKNEIIQAALIAKSDLDTKLVFEFTELQGEIGGIYAKRQGLSETISKAISEQYMPRFAEDKEPESLGGKLIALVDKLDNIIAYFAAGKIPKGSADPFALRRQANGLLQIIIHGELRFNLEEFLEKFINLNPIFLKNSEFSADELFTKLREFLEQRLEFVFGIYHKNPTINKAVISTDRPLQNLYNRHKIIHFMNEFMGNAEIGVCESSYAEFSQSAIRVNNMAKSFKDFNKSNIKIDNTLFKEAAEKELYKGLETLEPKLRKHFNTELDFSIEDLSSISSSINNFFEHVLVNDSDLKIKENRQALIYRLDEAFKNIADFSLLK
ncbi:MAG: glycine--tRNA ligase subunit beta [bacterium]